ncbi:hypothetical protein SDRG_02774 [Saprolegnia diclina VS20]|uniref:VLIG-type G domain-containing protein n=1 Tax=Saprolegnia diclina (strain VS20) TaxID=1156394 RepID=T0S4V6_SAPDV|nr:hypothetical protein SDRG_02774 [Saprolegnia diclina VS20]EQC40123.1 hypothetical protein SDRG_02774 [Saprolegnia diclina VS20]|eukprot:XP_008606597.1 hypothetical protein SDRG_02774 [Saprolegnia diclina VS20]
MTTPPKVDVGLKETLGDAVDASSHLQAAIRADDQDEIALAASRFNAPVKAMGLVQWIVDAKKLGDATTLLTRLRILDKMLTQTSFALSNMPPALTDDQVVARASSGSALVGHCFGFASPAKGVETAILQPPTKCQLDAPVLGTEIRDAWFNDVTAVTSFRAAIAESGRTAVVDSKAYLGDTLPPRCSSVAHVTYAFVPMKSFCLDVTTIALSEKALADARDVTSVEAAMDFLCDYGSHVHVGVFHVGGILWKTVHVKATSEAAVHSMKAACPNPATRDLSISYSDFTFQRGLDTIESTLFDAAKTPCEITTRIECTGPDAASYPIFQQWLVADRSTWHVIDRPAKRVGVWDLLAHAGLERASPLVRRAWLELVESTREASADVVAAVRDVYVDMWLHNPAFGTDAKHMPIASADDAVRTTNAQLDALAQANVEASAVVDIFLLALRLDSTFALTLTLDCLRDQRMHDALRRLVARNDIMAMVELGVMYHHVLDVLLMQMATAFDVTLLGALKRAAQLAQLETIAGKLTTSIFEWNVPHLDVRDVPIAVRIVLNAFRASSMPDWSLLTHRIGELLLASLAAASTPTLAALWGVAHRYGCREGGFETNLNQEHIQMMAEAMLEALDNGAKAAADSSDDEAVVHPSLVPSADQHAPVAGNHGQNTSQHPMSHLLTVVSKPDKTTDLPGLIWYTLKHRLSLVKELYSSASGAKGKRVARRASARDEAPQGPAVFDALLTLVDSLTPTARAEVYRLLLDRRCLVPFLVPSSDFGFRSEASALSLVETLLLRGKASLMRETSVKRVAVVSERATRSSATKDWIKNVFHVDSVHCLDRTNGNNVTNLPVVAELGWGFVEENTVYTTVMVLHVIGDYTLLESFIGQFADVLVIDTGAAPARMTLPQGTVLHWRLAEDDEDDQVLGDDGKVLTVGLASPMSSSYERITAYILEDDEGETPPTRCTVDNLPLPYDVKSDSRLPQHTENILAATDFATLRTDVLQLQQRFAYESALRIELQRETNPPSQEVLRQKIQRSEAEHKKLFRNVARALLLVYFQRILEHPSAVVREMLVIDLERRLAECCNAVAATAQAECGQAFAACSEVDNEATRSAYASALEKWSNMVTGLEHLWRELSHIYTANQEVYAILPQLAVQHLLDGFPLELMDGDAGMVNDKWIRAVLRSLDDTLPTGARVFVLSVMGVQSSGKSTLLNSMFGVRLRTSVARCTRGVNLQLLACNNCDDYDYVLLLDTEGIQSPEYVGVEGTVWRDNRMASVAILPADATIILTKGEATNTINDVLPIVLSVFANSELAAASGGHLMSKLYFAFNQIDVSQTSNMASSLRALLDSLRSSAKQIAAVRQTETATFLRDFRADMNDEAGSDVRFLGMTQGQTTPPNDVPLPDFGERLVRFRDHMHTRAIESQWQARTISELSESLDLVWTCLQSANFELDFASAHERVVYDRLVQMMTEHTQELAKIYSDAFDNVLQTMSADSAAEKTLDASNRRKYETLLEHHVESHVATLEAVVATSLNQDAFAKWATTMLEGWVVKKQRQAAHSARLVQSKVQHLFEYDAITKVYKEEIQATIVDHNARFGPEATMQAFDTIFNEVLTRASKKMPSLSSQVPKLVHAVIYDNHVFTPDELAHLSHDNNDKQGWAVALKRMIFSSSDKQSEPSRQDKVVDMVCDRVRSLLAEVDRYSDEAALTCALNVKRLLSTKSLKPPELKAGLRALVATLKDELQKRQERWDKANSVVAKFEAYRPTLHRFACSVCEGQKAAQLLSTTLNEWLGLNLTKAFEEEVVSAVASALKHARWVRAADAMQAALDQDLLQHMRQKDVRTVLDLIDRPKEHAEDVMSRLVVIKVKECYLGVAKKLLRDVEESLVSASAIAASAVSKRSECFVHQLRLTLQCRLKCSGTSALIESLPAVAGDVMNCDDQGPSVFALPANQDGLNVTHALLTHLATLTAHLGPSTQWSSTMADKVVNVIQNEAYGAVDGIMPRCGAPCPRCRCPCTKAMGHASTKHDALHDTYHQPEGLVGVYTLRSHELVYRSCATCVVDDIGMYFASGSRPYKEFEDVYPGWALPRVTKFLPLREYVFAQCQSELSQQFNKLKCTTIPASYSHNLEDIEDDIVRLLR